MKCIINKIKNQWMGLMTEYRGKRGENYCIWRWNNRNYPMNNREKTGCKEMNRASRTCDMNMEGLIFVIIGGLDKRRKRDWGWKITKRSHGNSYKLRDSRWWAKTKQDKVKVIHAKTHHGETSENWRRRKS